MYLELLTPSFSKQKYKVQSYKIAFIEFEYTPYEKVQIYMLYLNTTLAILYILYQIRMLFVKKNYLP